MVSTAENLDRNARAHARARARACDIKDDELEIVVLRARDIIVDESWNVRNADGSASPLPRADDPTAQLSFPDLVESVSEHGVINPVKVRLLDDGYQVIAGHSRVLAQMVVDPEKELPCTVLASTGDPELDEYRARAVNLAENLHRRNLEPYETAVALEQLRNLQPEFSVPELARHVGMSRGYCYQLLGFMKKACDELKTVFRRCGFRMPYGIRWSDVQAIAIKVPKHEQVAAWERLVAEHTGALNSELRQRTKRASVRQLKRYLRELAHVPGNDQYRAGLRYGLLVALGRQDWAVEAAAEPQSQQDETDDE